MNRGAVVAGALGLAAGAAMAADTWWQFDQASRSCESDVLKVRHGKPPSGYWGKGIIEFRHKAWNANYGYTLDCFGCGSAKYDRTGPSTYELGQATDDYVEVNVKYTDCVTVEKTERLYRGTPVLEIDYARVSVLWFEDFWAIDGSDPVYAMYGVDKEITRSEYSGTYACKPQNFGDCFIGKLGSTVANCTYKDHLIFGAHSKGSGRGVGEVYPVSMGVHDWKIWWSDRSVPNYEVFPKAKTNQKRWVFVYEGGRDGLIRMGKSILDNGGRPPATSVPPVARGKSVAPVTVSSGPGLFLITVTSPGARRLSVYDTQGRAVTALRLSGAGTYRIDNRVGGRAPRVVRVDSNDGSVTARLPVVPE